MQGTGTCLVERVSGAEVSVEAAEKFLEDIIGELGPLLVECGKRRCLGIEIEIPEQFLTDGAAFHRDPGMEKRTERVFLSRVKSIPVRPLQRNLTWYLTN